MLTEESLLVGSVGALTVFLTILAIAATRARDVFEPVLGVGLLHVLFFVVRPVMLASGAAPFHPLSFGTMVVLSVVGVLSLLSFYLGYFSRWPAAIARRLIYPSTSRPTRLVPLCTLYFLLAVTSLILMVRWVGLQTVQRSPIEVAMVTKVGGGYLVAGTNISLVLTAALFALRRFGRHQVPIIVLAAALAVALATSLTIGLRGVLASLVAVLVMVWAYSRRPVLPYRKLVSLVPVTLVVTWFMLVPMNQFRHLGTIDWNEALDRTRSAEHIVSLLQPIDWAGFLYENVKPMFWVPYLNLAVAPIPRQWWSEKPLISIEGMLTEQFGEDIRYGPTRTMTIPGELQLHLPYLGVILGMVAIGFILRLLYEYRRLHWTSWGPNLLYALVYVGTLKAFYTSFQSWSLLTAQWVLLLLPLFATGSRLHRPHRT